MGRRPLDAELVRRGLAGSRAEAQEAVRTGQVTVRGAPATKSTTLVGADEALALRGPARPFVSRGGAKLAAALDAFAVDPSGRDCLDAGASTGGFTDCLLQRGARHVVAARRRLRPARLGAPNGPACDGARSDERSGAGPRQRSRIRPSLVTADLSFISLRSVLGSLVAAADPRADLVLLVKPQFEAARDEVGRAAWSRIRPSGVARSRRSPRRAAAGGARPPP